MKIHSTALIAVTSVALSGCATITRGSSDNWSVNTIPAGAAVRTSTGFACDATPCAFKMPRKNAFDVTVTKTGFRTWLGHVTTEVGGGGAAGVIGNALIGGIIGIGVDMSTGAMNDLKPNPLLVTLERDDANAAAPHGAPITPSSGAIMVAYIVREIRPPLTYGTLTRVANENGVSNPADITAHDIAAAYARSHGYMLMEAPLLIDATHDRPADTGGALAVFARGARYIIDVQPPEMSLSIPAGSTADLVYSDRAKVVDVQSYKILEEVRCAQGATLRPDLLSRDALLADHAAELKKLISAKAEMCAAQLLNELKLPPAQTASTAR